MNSGEEKRADCPRCRGHRVFFKAIDPGTGRYLWICYTCRMAERTPTA